MIRYALRRLLHAAALLALISLASFALLQLAPGNYIDGMRLDARISAETAAAWRSRYGLDERLAVQYLSWLRSVFRGDFGFSFAYGMPVGALLWPRIKNTLLLTAVASAVSWSAALPMGVVAAANVSHALDKLIRSSLAILISVPDPLIALALLMFAVRTGFLPVAGLAVAAGPVSTRAGDMAVHLVLPVLALVLVSLPMLVRHVQTAVNESLASPYVQAARAHGIQRSRLWFIYTLPAAANPLISLFGYSIGGLLSASLLVEVIMGWPGLGPILLEAVFSRDIHIVIGATVLSALFVVTGNLVADLLLYAADPRIRRKK
jgi:peptide/nickel transport system permease protein